MNDLDKKWQDPIRDPRSGKIAVFNTLSWKRSGPVVFNSLVSGRSVVDPNGKRRPLQKLSNGNYVFMAEDVPALGTALYEISGEAVTETTGGFVSTDSSLSNGRLTVEWNKENGSIMKLLTPDRFNYAGEFNRQGLNSYWYVPGLDPAEAVSNGKVQVGVTESGPVQTTITMTSSAPGANGLERKLTLYRGGDELEIGNYLDKKAIRTKEAVHYGFPFDTTFRRTLVDAGYGSQQYPGDQLPGSNADYIYGRRWMDVSGMDRGIQLMLLETPMIEPGNMIDERLKIHQSHKEWKKEGTPTPLWFSYVMNNYWHTNFKIDQDGINRNKYVLRPHGMFNYAETEKRAAAFTQPLVGVPVNAAVIFNEGLFELSDDHIMVTNVSPLEGGGFLVRLYNPEPMVRGKPVSTGKG
ncbi:MAG: hypothetical protein IPI66_10370 [Chitinophagaceae bacterium]|nr:hypothetical protein [Chitinophagaceae bacterium]